MTAFTVAGFCIEESENLTQSPEKALYPINEEAGKLITKKGSEQMRLLKRAFTAVALLAALLIIIFLVGRYGWEAWAGGRFPCL